MEFRFGYWLFAGTLLSFLLMLYRRHWTLLAFFVPALYLFLIYPMCTYMMPRFYFPLLPYTVIANLMFVSVVVTKGMQKSR